MNPVEGLKIANCVQLFESIRAEHHAGRIKLASHLLEALEESRTGLLDMITVDAKNAQKKAGDWKAVVRAAVGIGGDQLLLSSEAEAAGAAEREEEEPTLVPPPSKTTDPEKPGPAFREEIQQEQRAKRTEAERIAREEEILEQERTPMLEALVKAADEATVAEENLEALILGAKAKILLVGDSIDPQDLMQVDKALEAYHLTQGKEEDPISLEDFAADLEADAHEEDDRWWDERLEREDLQRPAVESDKNGDFIPGVAPPAEGFRPAVGDQDVDLSEEPAEAGQNQDGASQAAADPGGAGPQPAGAPAASGPLPPAPWPEALKFDRYSIYDQILEKVPAEGITSDQATAVIAELASGLAVPKTHVLGAFQDLCTAGVLHRESQKKPWSRWREGDVIPARPKERKKAGGAEGTQGSDASGSTPAGEQAPADPVGKSETTSGDGVKSSGAGEAGKSSPGTSVDTTAGAESPEVGKPANADLPAPAPAGGAGSETPGQSASPESAASGSNGAGKPHVAEAPSPGGGGTLGDLGPELNARVVKALEGVPGVPQGVEERIALGRATLDGIQAGKAFSDLIKHVAAATGSHPGDPVKNAIAAMGAAGIIERRNTISPWSVAPGILTPA